MNFCTCNSCSQRIQELLHVINEAGIGMFVESDGRLLVEKTDISRLARILEAAKNNAEFRNKVYDAFKTAYNVPMYEIMLRINEAAKAGTNARIWQDEYKILEDTIKKLFGDLGFDKTPLELVHKAQEKIDGLEYHIEQLDKELKKGEGALKALRIDRDAIMTVSGLLPAEEFENEEALMRALEITAKRLGTITERLSEVRARKAEKP